MALRIHVRARGATREDHTWTAFRTRDSLELVVSACGVGSVQ